MSHSPALCLLFSSLTHTADAVFTTFCPLFHSAAASVCNLVNKIDVSLLFLCLYSLSLCLFFSPVRCCLPLPIPNWSAASLIFLLRSLFFNLQHESSHLQHEMNHRSLESTFDSLSSSSLVKTRNYSFLLSPPAHFLCALFLLFSLLSVAGSASRLCISSLQVLIFSRLLFSIFFSSQRLITLTL